MWVIFQLTTGTEPPYDLKITESEVIQKFRANLDHGQTKKTLAKLLCFV